MQYLLVYIGYQGGSQLTSELELENLKISLGTIENHGKKVEKNTAYFEKNREKHGKNTASKYDVFSIATHLKCPFLSHW